MENESQGGMDLTIPITIKELIAARASIIEAWHDCNRAIDSIDAAFARIHDKDFSFLDDSRSNRFDDRQDRIDIKKKTEALDYSLYVFALGKLNITNAMTDSARDEYLAKIKEKKTVFDEKQLIGLAQNANRIFQDSSLNTVRQVFRQLIGVRYKAPESSRLESKKDNLQKVEKCFRVGYSDLGIDRYNQTIDQVSRGYSNFTGFRFNDLLTACRLIEGEGFTDYSNNIYSFCKAAPKYCKWIDTGYFIATAYKNGNVKVTWNEDKIHVLERLNAIGSGRENAMPDTMRKRYKAEHFEGGGLPKAETFFKVTDDMEPISDKDFAFFPTRPSVVDLMIELAELPDQSQGGGIPAFAILDPEAGEGAILERIPWPHIAMGVEFNHHRAEILKTKFKNRIWEADFLKWESPNMYQRVIMNPPFNDRIEAVHTVKAFSHLLPGGILVGILPEGWFTRNDTKAVVMREFLDRHQHRPPEKLPPGTFAKTQVATRIIVLKKPE